MPARTENLRSFKVHDMITCESKVHFLLQSENVFELGGIKFLFKSKFVTFFRLLENLFVGWVVYQLIKIVQILSSTDRYHYSHMLQVG